MANPNQPPRNDRPCGELIKFYLPPNEQYKKGERIPVQVNGYNYTAIVGAKQELPEDVLQVLEHSKSSTAVPNIEKYDPERYGAPRSQDEFFNPEVKHVYQANFDVQRF